MKKIEKLIELFFSIISLLVAKAVSSIYFDGSFWVLLFLYVIMVWVGFGIGNVIIENIKKHNK